MKDYKKLGEGLGFTVMSFDVTCAAASMGLIACKKYITHHSAVRRLNLISAAARFDATKFDVGGRRLELTEAELNFDSPLLQLKFGITGGSCGGVASSFDVTRESVYIYDLNERTLENGLILTKSDVWSGST